MFRKLIKLLCCPRRDSPVIFIQQLGRGLRKAEDKEYVVVIDFIGNYRNNFMIPIALSGDLSYNKDNIRRYVTEGGRKKSLGRVRSTLTRFQENEFFKRLIMRISVILN